MKRMPTRERTVQRGVILTVAAVLLGGAALAWRAQRALLSGEEMAGVPCTRLRCEEVLRLGLSFPAATVEERSPVYGIPEYFVLSASQAAFLDVEGGAVGRVVVPPEAVRERFSSGWRIPWA